MASPQQNYPQPGLEQQQQENYHDNQHEVPETASPSQGGPPQPSAKDRRKRQYAGQAYDFGAGANSALGGQQQGGGQYPGPPGAGYPGQQGQQSGQQVPGYGSGPASPAPGGAPGYGQHPSIIGGYQPPETGYPAQGAPPQHHGSTAGITQGMGNMAIAGQQQHQTPQMQGRPPMNQLYPTDLLNQPVNVAELDREPPPIILPPNVSRVAHIFDLDILMETVQCHPLSTCKLLSKICPFDPQRNSHYALLTQKISATLCPSHSALHLAP